MIYNKNLNITEEDVSVQKDIEVLIEWRSSLDAQLSSMLGGVTSWVQLPPKAKTAYKYMFALKKAVYRKIGDMRFEAKQNVGWVSEANKRKERTLSMRFMQVAKRELPKDEYQKLLTLAQLETSED